jgi:ribose transport system ATP-binding protein
MDQSTALLGVAHLTKSYGGARALDAVSIEFFPGEVHALLGENGAGKSTLVKILAGVVSPDGGEIYGPAHDAGDVAMVFQELSVVPEMSVLDNLVLAVRGRRRGFVPYGAARLAAREALESAGLAGLADDLPVGVLSLAQRQLLEIARGLMASARVLILDEPTATLSDPEIRRVHAVVRRLVSEGRSVVYITHRLGEVFGLADRITVMRNGSVVSSGPTTAFELPAVIADMLGPDHVAPQKTVSALGTSSTLLQLRAATAHGRFTDITLAARGGEVLALFGQIGSGADDVIRSVAGITPLDEGAIALDGESIGRFDRSAAQKLGIAYVSADRVGEGVFLDAAVTTNISSGALRTVTRFGILRRRLENRLARDTATLTAFDPSRIGERVSAFSGGNQQKVAIGRAFATGPRVLVLNEPTRGVDIGARAEIYRSVRELASRDVAVVVYSSDVVEVRELADRVITLYRGRRVAAQRVDEVTDAELLADILGGARV